MSAIKEKRRTYNFHIAYQWDTDAALHKFIKVMDWFSEYF